MKAENVGTAAAPQEAHLSGLRSPFIIHKPLVRILEAVFRCVFILFELQASAVSLLAQSLVRASAEDLGEKGLAIVGLGLREDGFEVILHR